MSPPNPAQEELDALDGDIAVAVDAILDAAESALARVGGLEGAAAAAITADLQAILEACAIGDLAGQRLTKLKSLLRGAPHQAASDGLLNGPGLRGQALDQSAADSVFGFPSGRP